VSVDLPPWVTTDPQRSLTVSAGAGSGKTTSLVGRVAALLELPGVRLDEIVVITFTEKAAREVSHRLRQALGRGVALDDAFIGTIHGFCHSLLRRFPIEAGLPPKFTTADELTSGAMADERAEDAVQTLYNRALKRPGVEEALMVIASCRALPHLPDLVRAIDNDWLRFEQAPPAPPLTLPAALAGVQRLLQSIPGDERYHAATPNMRAKFDDAILDATSRFDVVESIPALAAAAAAFEDRLPRSDNWKIFDAVIRFARFQPALTRLMAELVPIVVGEARRRVADGELSFDDLLVLTRRLLQRRPDVRAAVRARHRYLFVDEFQDTDQVQYEILAELTAADAGDVAASLFAVGDPKQSIYGFRHADVSLFARLLAGAGPSAQLTVNRRTRADVCAWINAVLATRFAVDDGGQVEYADLEPLRLANGHADGPGVVVLGLPAGQRVVHRTAEEAARAEAADIAALAQHAVDAASAWRVTGPDGAERPATYGDITVLVRNRTRLGVLEHTLRQAGVPYRVEGGTLIYGSREVYELLRVLRAVDDPTNQLKLVTALRTSVFAIDDRQLMEFRLGPSGAPRPFAKDFAVYTDEAGPVGDALRALGSLGTRKHERTPAELLAELYDQWRGVPAALHEGEQAARETWRRVRYVIDEARAWSDSTGGTLAEYLAWVDRRIDHIDRVELSTDEHEDSVRIMTIHAAKGLEFPITVVAGLGGADAPDNATGVRWHQDRALVRLGILTSEGLVDMSKRERQRAVLEEARLLYVAFTRAKDHLVVSMHHKAGNCAAGRLLAAVCDETAMKLADCPEPQQPAWQPPDHDRQALAALLQLDEEPAEIDRVSGQWRRIWTPSGIAKVLGDAEGPTSDAQLVQGLLFDDDEVADDEGLAPGERFGIAVRAHHPDSDDREATDPGNRKEPRPNDRPSRRGGRFGTAKGSAVHAVMQQVTLGDTSAGLGTLIDVAAEAEGLLDRRHDIEVLVQSLLRGNLMARMRASSNCRREMYVGAQFGDVTVWGYVDAVFVEADGSLVLVDFKTDTMVTSPVELAARYQPQMSAYVAALQRATGRPVSEAWLAVAQPDGAPAVEIQVATLTEVQLVEALEATARAATEG
jgi:ATP-dependent helicase/nuclease subunit A